MIQILGGDLHYDIDQATKMATPFGGGLSRWGTVCGAVSGGAMALGFRFGRSKAEEKEKREEAYAIVQKFLREFEGNFGTIQCKELIKLNLLDPADRQKFQDQKLSERCSQFVVKSVEIARRLAQEK